MELLGNIVTGTLATIAEGCCAQGVCMGNWIKGVNKKVEF
jgi:hypothetical protein